MLIITRRPGEKIMLGDDIVVHVMEIVGNTVALGIEAPRSLPVYREEIWDAVREENRAAAGAAPAPPQPAPSRPPNRDHGGRQEASPRPRARCGSRLLPRVARRVRSARPTSDRRSTVMAIRMKVLLLGGAAVAAGAAPSQARPVAGLLPSQRRDAPARAGAPAGPRAVELRRPRPGGEHRDARSGARAPVQPDRSTRRPRRTPPPPRPRTSAARPDYAGPEGERRHAEEWRPLAEAGEGEAEGQEQTEAELREAAEPTAGHERRAAPDRGRDRAGGQPAHARARPSRCRPAARPPSRPPAPPTSGESAKRPPPRPRMTPAKPPAVPMARPGPPVPAGRRAPQAPPRSRTPPGRPTRGRPSIPRRTSRRP